GQALPAVLGAGLMLILAALVLAAIGGAATGRGRVQRAADLAALSAVRSMRDDVPGLLAPARLPDGSLNPTPPSIPPSLGGARRGRGGAARGAAPRPSRPPAPHFPGPRREPPAPGAGDRGRGNRCRRTAGRRAAGGSPGDQGRGERGRGGLAPDRLLDGHAQ